MKFQETSPGNGHEDLERLARVEFDRRMAEHQQRTQEKMIQAMRDNGADPAYIYAFEKTGVLVFQETMDSLPPEDLERWAEAYEEYTGEESFPHGRA